MNKTHSEKAMSLFKSGYNCSQAVLCAYCEELGVPQEQGIRISSGFGGGMGRLREVCGAVTGAFMVLNLRYGSENPNDRQAKSEQYARIQRFAKEFEKENGSYICRELLGLDRKHDVPTPEARTEGYYKKRPCAELVGLACEILDREFPL